MPVRSKVYAPFNFVPLSSKVFYPDWSEKISQDKPFEEGLSGWIDLTIAAKMPIFVSDGHTKREEDERKKEKKPERAAKTPDGRFYLPATSVKGCVRNVLEILGNCKMKIDPRARFAQREWSNNALYTLKDDQSKILGGWIKEDENGDYVLKECKRIYRIGLHCIDELLGSDLMKRKFFGSGKLTDEEKTSSYKYKMIRKLGKSFSIFRDLTFKEDDEVSKGRNWTRVRPDDDGDIRGTIVLTGQPDMAKFWKEDREGKMGAGKYYEFVFEDSEHPKKYKIPEELFKQYDRFIYKDNADWAFAKKELKDPRGIPVFFRVERDNVKDFGLALLYKLPYSRTPADIEGVRRDRSREDQEMPDLAECIFGYTGKEKSLRGRVQFSNFISENAKESREYILILNGPKASYYPIYIKQDNRGGQLTGNYKTYNDGELSGWKRYHIREQAWEKKTDNDDVDSRIVPLEAGATFTGRVRFHNMLPQELGALLSAITFHQTEGCYHQIGKAKPYGFGKVEMNVAAIHVNGEEKKLDDDDVRRMFARFEMYVHDNAWWETIANELVTIASKNVPDEEQYKYMTLEMTGRNDFTEAKGGDKGIKYSLPWFSAHGYGRKTVNKDFYELCLEEKQKAEEQERICKEQEKEEQDRIAKEEKERETAEAAKRADEEKKRKLEEKKKEGLAFLEKTNIAGKYYIDDFNEVKKRVNQWLEKAEYPVVPEDEIPRLKAALDRIKEGGKKAIKGWNNDWISKVTNGKLSYSEE